MGTRVLVTGSASRVDAVAAALRQAGAEVISAPSLDRLADEVEALAPGSLDCYIQLPVTLQPSGDTVVSRVRDFLDSGLMSRFRMAEAVLPALSAEGRVLLVGGNTPVEGGAPDDQRARVAFLHVLAHAIRADKAPAKVRVRVVQAERDAANIAKLALAWETAGVSVAAEMRSLSAREEQMSYQDWRTEVLGLASIEF